MANALTAYAMKNFRNGQTYHDWAAIGSPAKNFGCGYYNGGENWTVAVRITVNDYIDRVTHRFCMTIDNMDWSSENVTWSYKIFSSESALNAAANYSTGNKGDGTVTWDKGSGKTTTFNVWAALSAGTYYILFWRTTAKGCEIRWGNYAGNNTYYSYMTATSAERYTVSYNANGGSGAPSSQQKIKGFALTLSSTKPTRSADKSTFTITGSGNGGITKTVTATKTVTYSFAGWATSSGGSVVYQPGGTYSANAGATLYAVWNSTVSYSNNTIAALGTTTRGNASAGKYTVTFNANGGSCDTASKDAARTTAYTFQGWGSSSSAGSSLPGSTAYTSATTVYARWAGETTTASVTLPTPTRSADKSTFTITGDGNGGTTKTATATKTTSYTFTGWATSPGGSAAYESGDSYTPGANVTLYAIWTSTVSYSNNTIAALGTTTRANTSAGKYTVTFDANGGSCGTKAAEAARTASYTFLGWGSSRTAISNLASSKAYTSAATVYARWSIATTTAWVVLPIPERAGYIFMGWAETADAESGVTGQYKPSKNITLYAIWKANGLLHIFAASQWAAGIVWVYAGGEWCRGIPWIYDGSHWKIGG